MAALTTAPDAPTTPAPQRNAARDTTDASVMQVLALRWGAVLFLLVVWEVVVDAFAKHNSFFASPSAVVVHGLSVFNDSGVTTALATTAERFGLAFLITTGFGVPIGLVLGRMTRIAPIARNVAAVLYSVPQVAFYPLFIVWFGLGPRAEIAFGVSHGLIPVVLGTIAAAGTVDPELLEASSAMGGGRISQQLKVVLPSCLPQIVGALRLGAGLSLLGVLLAELLVSVDGVGGIMNQLSGTLQPARLDALLLSVSLAAVLINLVVGRVERGLSRSRGTV